MAKFVDSCFNEIEMRRIYRVIRRHIITGFIFLMPVLVAVALINKFWDKIITVAAKVSKLLFINALIGPGGNVLVALVLLLLLCLVAGFLVRLTFFKKMSDRIDQKLTIFIPGYTDLKKEAQKKIGEVPVEKAAVFETCLVQDQECWKPAYLIDIADNGDTIVFFPAAPTFETGQVAIIPKDCYRKLSMDSQTLNACLKQFGKGIVIV
ncbi:hypothetical protein A4H97_21010 [Niastella yeongjuensis]|uniref:DUF502 domain-containing protein n=1 Tax=Niastella yeongjuensis TaxID=354355 RepID=A0A1V9FCF6_9BACT|nr:hypothetical protein [Niastella yeongjuensis]OQP56064.1 hypothetical protein A4H97_21010 [Niastella yeongjuensis]SEP24116.1 Uncharacterized membrane protein [Niastella yeongjuensis]